MCMVQRPRQYSLDLPQEDLETPCTLMVTLHIEKVAKKAERLPESALGSKCKKVAT